MTAGEGDPQPQEVLEATRAHLQDLLEQLEDLQKTGFSAETEAVIHDVKGQLEALDTSVQQALDRDDA